MFPKSSSTNANIFAEQRTSLERAATVAAAQCSAMRILWYIYSRKSCKIRSMCEMEVEENGFGDQKGVCLRDVTHGIAFNRNTVVMPSYYMWGDSLYTHSVSTRHVFNAFGDTFIRCVVVNLHTTEYIIHG